MILNMIGWFENVPTVDWLERVSRDDFREPAKHIGFQK